MKYFGYKLVMPCILDGIPVDYDLVAANTDERDCADTMFSCLWNYNIYADKGFIGVDRLALHFDTQGNRICPQNVLTSSFLFQNPAAFDRWLNGLRERIEGAFNERQNTRRNLGGLLRKTVTRLASQVIAKVASHTLKLLLRKQFGIDVQTFSAIS